MSMVWWFVSLMGVVQIVVESGLFQPVRRWIGERSGFWGQMIVCPLCFGVWLGGGMSLVGFGSPSMSFVAFPAWWERLGWPGGLLARLVAALLDGAALSFAAMAWTSLRNRLARPSAAPISPRVPGLGPVPWEEGAAPVQQVTKPLPPKPPAQRVDPPCSICPSAPSTEAVVLELEGASADPAPVVP